MQELPHVTHEATGNYVATGGWRPGRRFPAGTRIAIHAGELEPFTTLGAEVADQLGAVVLRLNRPIGYCVEIAGARMTLVA